MYKRVFFFPCSKMIQVSRVSAIFPGPNKSVRSGEEALSGIVGGNSCIAPLSDAYGGCPSSCPVSCSSTQRSAARPRPRVGNPLPVRCASSGIEAYNLPTPIVDLLSDTCKLAVMVGLDALESSGIVSREGPEPWALPAEMRERTGVVYASSFAHHDRVLDCVHEESRMAASDAMSDKLRECGVDESIIASVQEVANEVPSVRKLALQMTLLANAQLAQIIKARGPNTYTSNTCASTASAIKFACNSLRLDEADRMLVVSADTPLSGGKASCMTESFVTLGAATSAETVQEAVQPFGSKRSGFVFGEGAVSLLLEKGSVAEDRNAPALARVIATRSANSALHGTRLDADHIASVIQDAVRETCLHEQISMDEFSDKCVYVSHDTFTSLCANAEVEALEKVFGRKGLQKMTITNSKCVTGHMMGVCVEDLLAVLMLHSGRSPCMKEVKVDPNFEDLTFSSGAQMDCTYALHLACGMGSHVAVAVYGKAKEKQGAS